MNEIIHIQPLGSKAKAYQVEQIRNIIIKYKLIDVGGARYVPFSCQQFLRLHGSIK